MLKEVLGISKVDEGKRVYFPKDTLNALGIKLGDKVSFQLGTQVTVGRIQEGSELQEKVGSKQRVFLPKPVMGRLGLEVGSNIIFLKEGGKIVVSKLEERLR